MGVFDNEVNLYRVFHATLKFRGWLVGGQPKSPKALREMILRKAGAGSEELLRRDLIRLAQELEIEITPAMPLETLEQLTEARANKTGNGFHCDPKLGLYIESYQVKAAFRESCNIAFAGERWGKTKKGAKSYLAERLFISPDRIYLDRQQPDGVSVKTGVVTGPQGKRSIMTQFEYVDQPQVTLNVKIARDAEELFEHIGEIWVRMQDNGLGAMRSSGFGTFDITDWHEQRRLKKAA